MAGLGRCPAPVRPLDDQPPAGAPTSFGRTNRAVPLLFCLADGRDGSYCATMYIPRLLSLAAVVMLGLPLAATAQVVYMPKDGPGQGKHVVLLAGDEEYRSEEGLPMLGKLLSQRHGFKATVVFPIDPKTGEIDPNNQTNLPGMEALKDADCVVMLWRFRNPTAADLKHFADYFAAGKPVIGLRTSTHAFNIKEADSPFAKWDWQAPAPWTGGFGQHVLGETWISHHGDHGSESTRGLIAPGAEKNPLLQGVTDVWGPTDVYGIKNLPSDATVLLLGQVIAGMKPTDPPVNGPKNNPMMPVAWTREFKNESGKTNQIFNTTLGAATDLESAGLRRLLVNAVYKMTGLTVPAQADVTPVGEFKPTEFGFNKFIKGVKPEAHALKE